MGVTVLTVASIIRKRLRMMVEMKNNPAVLNAMWEYLFSPDGKFLLMVLIMVMTLLLSQLRITADNLNMKLR